MKKFVNGERSFFGKLDTEETFLWISSTIGVFVSMTRPIEHKVHIIIGVVQVEVRIWWDSVMNSTFGHRQLQDVT